MAETPAKKAAAKAPVKKAAAKAPATPNFTHETPNFTPDVEAAAERIKETSELRRASCHGRSRGGDRVGPGRRGRTDGADRSMHRHRQLDRVPAARPRW
jgi:hypothetical protein